MDRRKTGTRSIVGLVLGAAAGASLVAASACLPDLVAARTSNDLGAPDVVPVNPPTCGDGVIDTIENGGSTNEECDPGDAGSVGCTADCKIACEGGVIDPVMGHCYYVAGATPNYPEAPSLCVAAHAHVVTLGTEREVELVNAAHLTDGGFWTGLQLISAVGYVTPRFIEPGWPATGNACPGCFAVAADDAGRFANEDAGSDCVLAGGARWSEHACGGRDVVSVVCEREPVGQRIYFCGGPNCTDIPATFGTKRYVLPTELVAGTDAVAACAPYGSLVMLDSAEEREQLVRELVTRFPAPQTVWIGLSVHAGAPAWDDGKADRPAPWANNEPAMDGRAFLSIADPQVITFDTQLAHVDGDDTARRLVVCQRK